MGIFRLIFWGRPKPAARKSSVRKSQEGTPIHSVRRQFFLLGKVYTVELKREAPRNAVQLDQRRGVLVVSLNPPTRENFETYIDGWYRRQARKLFEEAATRGLELLHEAGHAQMAAPRLKIYQMRRAWGRCYYTKQLITVNLHLAKAPQVCIDYILLHELCHFMIHNHSKEFYALMESLMPEWKAADLQLKDFARKHRIIR